LIDADQPFAPQHIVVEELADPSIGRRTASALVPAPLPKERNLLHGPELVTELKKNSQLAVCIGTQNGRILGVSIHMRNSTAIAPNCWHTGLGQVQGSRILQCHLPESDEMVAWLS
jgi:hypothetical protein